MLIKLLDKNFELHFLIYSTAVELFRKFRNEQAAEEKLKKFAP